MPNLAERYWIRMAMAFDQRSTHKRVYPNRAPPSKLLAKLPGSTYATLATKAGPKYLHISPRFNVGSSFMRALNGGRAWVVGADIKHYSIRDVWVLLSISQKPQNRASQNELNTNFSGLRL